MTTPMPQAGHLYIQTNEVRNFVIHYLRGADGKLTEVERVSTGGAGSGTYKPPDRSSRQAGSGSDDVSSVRPNGAGTRSFSPAVTVVTLA